MSRRLLATFVIVALLTAVAPAGALAASPLTVELEGRQVSIADIPTLHCHDLDTPIIRCYRTEAALQAALSTYESQPDALESLPYVQMYEDINYGGSSFTASSNYPNLGSIGWNNRVSSFKGLNSYYGTFYQNASYVGSYWAFGPNQQVSNVGTAWNDQFSSVLRN